jgi:hypothetical protein
LGGFDREALDIWARGHLLRLDHQTFPAIWLGSAYQLYTAHFPISDTLPVGAQPHDAVWPSDALKLAGVDPIIVSANRDRAQVNLYWQLDQPAQRNFDFALRLVDHTGAEWGLWQGAAFDNWSAKQWPVGQYIRQTASINLPHGLPAGEYVLVVSVADRQTKEVIPPGDGSAEVEVATVRIDP